MPINFDLVISYEAHRSINGNSRAVYEYFIGYKLGLTATANPDWTFYEADTAQVSVYALAVDAISAKRRS